MFRSGNDCLHMNVRNNDVNGLLKNLSSGADVDFQNHHGDTPLMLACSSTDSKCAKLLISFGANTEKINKFGRSALHIAACNGNLDIFTLLLNNGANYDRRDCAGKTPFDVLLENSSRSFIEAYFDKVYFSPSIQKTLSHFKNIIRTSSNCHKQQTAFLPRNCAHQTIIDRKEKQWKILNDFMANLPIVLRTELQSASTVQCTTTKTPSYALENMLWNRMPVSVCSVSNETSSRFRKNSKLFELSRHHTCMEILWLSHLRHPHIILLLGITRPLSHRQIPSLIFEQICMGCLHGVITEEHSLLSTRDRLMVVRQISEALIHLKKLGIVHSTVSSYSIYLVDSSHAKLANFRHALLWRERCEGRGWWTPGTGLSEEEIGHLGAWLAPEVVLLSRSSELEVKREALTVPFCTKGGGVGDPAHHGIFGSDGIDCGNSITLTPATDTFGVARVMQELFEPHCIHRFCRLIPPSNNNKSMQILEEAEKRRLHSYLRPAIRKALQSEPKARGETEDLHIAIVRAFGDIYNKPDPLQYQGRIGFTHRRDRDSILTNTTSTSSCREDSTSDAVMFQLGNQQLESEKENQIGMPQEERNLNSVWDLVEPKHLRTLKHTAKSKWGSGNKPVLKQARTRIMPPYSVAKEKPRPLNSSSPISIKLQTQLDEKRVSKGQTMSLTKEQYIEMVAIPCDSLGPGRSRPLVPWRSPSAPAHLPYSSSATTSSTSSSASILNPNSERVSGQNSVVDKDGKWIKIIHGGYGGSLQQSNFHSTSGRVWSMLSKRFRKEHKLMSSRKPPIKPASHLTTPPVVPGSTNKKQRVRLKGVSRFEDSFSRASALLGASLLTYQKLSSEKSQAWPLPTQPPLPMTLQNEMDVKINSATTSENKGDQNLTEQALAWLALPKQQLSNAETKFAKAHQVGQNTTRSNAMEKVRQRFEDVRLQNTTEVAKTA